MWYTTDKRLLFLLFQLMMDSIRVNSGWVVVHSFVSYVVYNIWLYIGWCCCCCRRSEIYLFFLFRDLIPSLTVGDRYYYFYQCLPYSIFITSPYSSLSSLSSSESYPFCLRWGAVVCSSIFVVVVVVAAVDTWLVVNVLFCHRHSHRHRHHHHHHFVWSFIRSFVWSLVSSLL